jgi:hypothetical protein
MELLIALTVSAAVVGLYSAWQSFWKGHRQMQQSLVDHEAVMAARAKSDADGISTRVLVRLEQSSQVAGWAPCQHVAVPAGEYIAYLAKFSHDARNGREDSICFVDVPQDWRGERMKRDVFVRIADYPFLSGFPKVTDTPHIRVLSNTL